MTLLELTLILALLIPFTKEIYDYELMFCDNIKRDYFINNLLLWKNKGESSKYQDIIDYIKNNPSNDKLLEFEKKLKRNKIDYLIYKYRFKDGMTFKEITTILNINNPRLVERLDKIALALKLYCDIEN